MSDQKKVIIIDVDALAAEIAGPIRVGGVVHQVRKITFGTKQRLSASDDGDDFVRLREAVRDVVPDLPDDALDKLNIPQARAILLLSGSSADAVAAMFPNVEGPETTISPA